MRDRILAAAGVLAAISRLSLWLSGAGMIAMTAMVRMAANGFLPPPPPPCGTMR